MAVLTLPNKVKALTVRELPPEDWPSLAGTDLAPFIGRFDPASVRVVVVESDGRIVGCWALLMWPHAEGIWIDPDHRGRAGVFRGLLRGMADLIRDCGATGALMGVQPHTEAMLTKLGGVPLPCPLMVVPLGESCHRL